MTHTINYTWYKEEELPNGETEEVEKESTYSFWINWQNDEVEGLELEDGEEPASEEDLINKIEDDWGFWKEEEDSYYRSEREYEKRKYPELYN